MTVSSACPDFRVRRRESCPPSSASVAMAIHLHADRPQGGAAGRRAACSISACQAAATAGGHPAFVLAASLHRGHGQGSSRRPVPLSSSRPRSGPLSRRQRRRWSRCQSQIRARPPLLPPTSPVLLDADRLSADGWSSLRRRSDRQIGAQRRGRVRSRGLLLMSAVP